MNWVTIKTFTSSSNSHRTSLSETHSVSKGYSYRVQALIAVLLLSQELLQEVVKQNINTI